MTLNFELVRGNERLECDFLVWSDTTELARAFGWKPYAPAVIVELARLALRAKNETAQ
jgi:hypothetical protein